MNLNLYLFSSRRRHTSWPRDWSSDVCSSDLNLTFVVNCNLQRLDGPVRGNGKIIQELEAFFRGAGWNVIKVIWGREWDPLLNADKDRALVNLMNQTLRSEERRVGKEGRSRGA